MRSDDLYLSDIVQAVHAYFSVDWRLVWNAAASDSPMLKRDIEAIVKAGHGP